MIKTLLILIAIFVALIFFISQIIAPFIVYRIILVRTNQKKWGRKCSSSKNPELIEMFKKGEEWSDSFQSNREEVRIESDGFKLAGQYFDFGKDKAAIIVAGRMESCLYSCYYAEPYRKMGYNILLIDNRSHGLSEGKYNNTGFTEYVDILAWAKFLHQKKHNQSIICHGICIGAATSLYALVDKDCPNYMTGLVADGMFTTFRESFKNHLTAFHIARFPATQIVMAILKKHSHVDAFHYGPISVIQDYRKPILFLYSQQDKFSLPKNALELYEKCCAPKKIVWFNKGVHSHIRINNTEKYDSAICDFIQENLDRLENKSPS